MIWIQREKTHQVSEMTFYQRQGSEGMEQGKGSRFGRIEEKKVRTKAPITGNFLSGDLIVSNRNLSWLTRAKAVLLEEEQVSLRSRRTRCQKGQGTCQGWDLRGRK